MGCASGQRVLSSWIPITGICACRAAMGGSTSAFTLKLCRRIRTALTGYDFHLDAGNNLGTCTCSAHGGRRHCRAPTCLGLTFGLVQVARHRHHFLRFRHLICGNFPAFSIGQPVIISRGRRTSGIGGGWRGIPIRTRFEGGGCVRATLDGVAPCMAMRRKMIGSRSLPSLLKNTPF
jgi:hypothetical protein